jgi:predicted enzyme related to lactoylglutathione lyase
VTEEDAFAAPAVGSVAWFDLTVPDADRVRDFYAAVVGWTAEPIDMGEYSDYAMKQPGDGNGVAGICYARGANAGQPPVWMAYIQVENLTASVDRALELGGAIVSDRREPGNDYSFVVIRDPAGAMIGLMGPQ